MLIDAYLPNYEVRDFHQTIVDAESRRVYHALRSLNFNRSLIVRTLFAIRSIPARLLRRSSNAEQTAEQSFIEYELSIGWQILDEIPDREIVCGAVTQTWKFDVKFQGMPAPALKAFSEPGFTKIVWRMASLPEPDGRARVVLETRVATTDQPSRRKFKRYWFVFGPFIGLIRVMILRLLKRELIEQSARRAESHDRPTNEPGSP